MESIDSFESSLPLIRRSHHSWPMSSDLTADYSHRPL